MKAPRDLSLRPAANGYLYQVARRLLFPQFAHETCRTLSVFDAIPKVD